jgi:hypothetical protein
MEEGYRLLLLNRRFFGDDTIVLRCALGAIANLFASWIVSHKGRHYREAGPLAQEPIVAQRITRLTSPHLPNDRPRATLFAP